MVFAVSIKIMSAVWENGPRGSAETMVLLALADYCNDEGECWPSVQGIATKARMTERGVQKIVARLVEGGWLEVEAGGGRKNCNLYRIKNPEQGSPRTRFTPNVVAETPNTVPKNPEPRSPEPSLTIIEPSEDKAASRSRRRPEVPLPPDWVPSDRNLEDAEARQFSAQEAHDEAERFRDYHLARDTRFRDWDAAWRTWLGNARRFAKPAPQGRKRPDPALEQIARLTGLGSTPGNGRGGIGSAGEEDGPLWMGTRPQ